MDAPEITVFHEIELPRCKSCGLEPMLFKGIKQGAMLAIASMSTKLPTNTKHLYLYMCHGGCKMVAGPAPTISLAADIWRMLNE